MSWGTRRDYGHNVGLGAHSNTCMEDPLKNRPFLILFPTTFPLAAWKSVKNSVHKNSLPALNFGALKLPKGAHLQMRALLLARKCIKKGC
jgi:hypothetical protein